MRNDPSDDFAWSFDVADKHSYCRNSEHVHKIQFQVSRESEQQMLWKLPNCISSSLFFTSVVDKET